MAIQSFYAWPLTNAELESGASRSGLPFADSPRAGSEMASELFRRLEPYGPLRLVVVQINEEFGLAFVPGHNNEDISAINPAQLELLTTTFLGPPRKYVLEEVVERRYTTPRGDGGVDMLLRGGSVMTNLVVKRP